jgi:hypothetical protein
LKRNHCPTRSFINYHRSNTEPHVKPLPKAARAEGLLAKRTGIVAAGFGAQALISDDDVAALRTARRDDLPGQPLVWQVSLRSLVSQLADTAIAN